MLFIQAPQGPANTDFYTILGYAVIFTVILIYLASLAIRQRNLKQDLDLLTDLEKKKSETAAPQKATSDWAKKQA